MIRPLLTAALATAALAVAGCDKPAEKTAGATGQAASVPASLAPAPGPAPDISGQPVAGSVASAEGAATIDLTLPAPAVAPPAR